MEVLVNMKKDNLLKLIELIKNDEFISSNVKYLFPGGMKIDYRVLLELSDNEIEYLLGLDDSKLRFIQLYFSMNSKYQGTIFKRVSKDLDLEIASIIVDLIIAGYDVKRDSKLGDIIFRMLSSSGIKQARYASEVVKKCLVSKKEFPGCVDNIIGNVCSASTEYQAEYASKFLLSWKMNLDNVDRVFIYSKVISEAKGIAQAKRACEYAIGHKTYTYGKSLVYSLANAIGIVQLECAVKMINELEKWNDSKKLKYDTRYVESIKNVAMAKGDIQALRATELYMNDTIVNNYRLSESVKFIADAEYGYQAGYASLVIKNNVYNKQIIAEITEIITNSKGPGQTEYASYLAVDKEILKLSFATEVIEMVARAIGELQAELAYLVIKKTDLLSRYNGLVVLDAIVTMADERECIRIRKNLVDYIEKLPYDVCLKLIGENYYEKDDSTFSLYELMEIDDLDIIMDLVSSIDEEEIVNTTEIVTRKLVKSIENNGNRK